MSIIHNALKKAQNELKKKDVSKTDSSSTSSKKNNIYDKIRSTNAAEKKEIKPNKKKSKIVKKKKSRSAVLFLFLIGVICLSIVYFNKTKDSNFILEKIKSFQPLFSKKSSKPKPKTYDPKDIIFEGAVMMGERQVALINGEVYELGQKFKDMKIVRITLKEVDLLYDGAIKTIKVK